MLLRATRGMQVKFDRTFREEISAATKSDRLPEVPSFRIYGESRVVCNRSLAGPPKLWMNTRRNRVRYRHSPFAPSLVVLADHLPGVRHTIRQQWRLDRV